MFKNLNSIFDYLTADFTLNFNNYQLDGFNQLQDSSVNTDFYDGEINLDKAKNINAKEDWESYFGTSNKPSKKNTFCEKDWESYFGINNKPRKAKNTIYEKDWESYFGIITKDSKVKDNNKVKTIKFKDDFYI